ncbi:hypothetical protein F5Y17DRAFT_40734 [Xylariaceae sp. FL0594]|nr:hypothetical protein F5Y17DRAFT_40734 [Xylariaceae sp. FL0594]
MAANLNALPMGGGVPNLRRQPQQQFLSTLLYTQISSHQYSSGWQSTVRPQIRVIKALNILTNSFLAMQHIEPNQIINSVLAFEREAFERSPDQATYEARIGARVNELFKKRQANEANLHSSLSAQAAAQAQAHAQAQAQPQQMMMGGQNMSMRAMGQPLPPGFQNPQHQVSPPAMNQPGQINMGLNHPNNLQMNPANPQMMQMGDQMRPRVPNFSIIPGLTHQEQVRVQQLALQRFNHMPEQQRASNRMVLNSKLPAELAARLAQDNIDPLIYFLQNSIATNLRNQRGVVNPAGMAMQGQQNRAMNQPGQQMPGGPNAAFGFSNAEIINQQKAGMMAQEAGQMVVPASSVGARNATPQPLGPSQGPPQGPNQSAMAHGLPHQFNQAPPIPQHIMDQRAAQTQAEIRAQAQAKQMQGQPGGLNGPGAVSQSPAMNTLNAPVRRPPMVGAQADGHPPAGQGNVPFGQPMSDPRFNQMSHRPVVGPSPNGRNQMLHSILQQMPPDVRQEVLKMPADKIPEIIVRWNASRRGVAPPGHPQPQPGQIGPVGAPGLQPMMGQFSPGTGSAAQQPGLGMPVNQQNQLMMQQMSKMRNPAVMDSLSIPPKVLDSVRANVGNIPPDVKKWGQLKQWLSQNPSPRIDIQQILSFQNAQYQTMLKNQGPGQGVTGHHVSQPNIQQQGANGQVITQTVPPAPGTRGANAGFSVTPQELESARNMENFKGWSDERIEQALLQMRYQINRRTAPMHMGGFQAQPSQPKPSPVQAPPTQILQPPAPPVAQPGPVPAASTLQPANGAGPLQREPAVVPEANSGNSGAAQNRSNSTKQPQGRGAPPSKKRRSSDDAVEVTNPSSTPLQRAVSQQQQAQPVSAAPAQPQGVHLTPEQVAALNPEQRQKYDALVKSRQNGVAEALNRLKAIGQEQHQIAIHEQLPDVPMTSEQYRETAQRIQGLCLEMTRMSKLLSRWYALTRDDAKARLFFKMRLRLIKQYVDGEKLTTLKDKFTISTADLERTRAVLENIAGDLANYSQSMKKNLSQQNAQEAALPPAAPVAQPVPLNAANLEKQTQALSKVHQKSANKAVQPPAAPTTAQPPFPFGAQSPDGQPTYAGKPAVTQDNLQLPPRKKARTNANVNGASASASPQVQKQSSPQMTKRPATGEAKQAPAKHIFTCPEQGCEFHSIGFPDEMAQRKHMEDEHTKPAEDPLKYATEALAEALGLDANGKPKKTAAVGSNVQSPSDGPKQQSQASPGPGRPDPTNARGSPMWRQGSTAGSKPNDLIKSIAGKTGTPKPEANLASTTSGATGQHSAANEAMGSTIDPQDLLFRIPGLDVGGGGAISDMSLYRSITPNFTPESAQFSASSEPNSDVSEGVSLNIALDVGVDQWDPFAGPTLDPDTDFTLNANDLSGIGYPPFTSWDEVNIDFDKPFVPDSSLFSLDVA